MTRLGYLSRAQETLCVSCNTLDAYATALAAAMSRPHPAYETIGLRSANGYRQLSTSLLQQESEYYSGIRPKRVPGPGERQLHALRSRGIEYVEVRVLDADAYEPIGIAAQTARFVDVFLLHCLLAPSPPDLPEEIRACARNDQEVAARGRDPLLCLQDGGRRVSLRDWGAQVLDQCAPVAAALDAALGGHAHQIALADAMDAFSDPELLPSARVLRDVRENHGGSFAAFARVRSFVHRERLQHAALPAETAARLALQAEASLEAQRRLERDSTGPFEPFRQQYLSPASLGEAHVQEPG
jgi:glutamate--cysteine ligase